MVTHAASLPDDERRKLFREWARKRHQVIKEPWQLNGNVARLFVGVGVDGHALDDLRGLALRVPGICLLRWNTRGLVQPRMREPAMPLGGRRR